MSASRGTRPDAWAILADQLTEVRASDRLQLITPMSTVSLGQTRPGGSDPSYAFLAAARAGIPDNARIPQSIGAVVRS